MDLNYLNDKQNLLLTRISNFADEMTPEMWGKSFNDILKFGNISGDFRDALQDLCNSGLGDLKIRATESKLSGLKCVAFEDSNGNVGFSYYGTDSLGHGCTPDMINNASEAAFGCSIQCWEALWFFDKWRASGERNFLFGHSHGGALCQYIFIKRDYFIKSCFLFNPLPLGNSLINDWDKLRNHNGKIRAIVTVGDFISSMTVINDIESAIGSDAVVYAEPKGERGLFFTPYHVWDNVNLDGNDVAEVIRIDTDDIVSMSEYMDWHISNIEAALNISWLDNLLRGARKSLVELGNEALPFNGGDKLDELTVELRSSKSKIRDSLDMLRECSQTYKQVAEYAQSCENGICEIWGE